VTTAEKSAQIEPSTLGERYCALTQRLRAVEAHFGRPENGTCLVAISKARPAQGIGVDIARLASGARYALTPLS